MVKWESSIIDLQIWDNLSLKRFQISSGLACAHNLHLPALTRNVSQAQRCFAVISIEWYRAVRCRPQALLSVLIMQIMHNFGALSGGTGAVNARYGWCDSDGEVEKAFIV